MKCRELAELLVDYVAGELASDLADHIKNHLCLCGPCERYLKSYEVTIKITRRLPLVPVPPEMLHRLREALEEAGVEKESVDRSAPDSEQR